MLAAGVPTLIFLPFLIAVSPLSGNVVRMTDGAVVATPHGKIRLQVWTDSMIRIVESPTNVGVFHIRPSLVVTGKPRPTKFQIREAGGRVMLSTPSLRVSCDPKTGALDYYDKGGRKLLDQPASPAFTPKTVLDQSAFAAEQRFTMPAGEGYYGLGGHQNGVLNYANSSVTMVQDNTEDVNPFLISSKGYGLLWDAPCGMRIDFGGRSGPIADSALFDDSGASGGLTGHYFKGRNFEQPVVDRKDAGIDFLWTKTPPPGLPHDDYSIRWTGSIQTEAAGEYSFETTADDGVRLWVDGKLIVDDWKVQGSTRTVGRIKLAAHRRYPIKMEFFQMGGDSVVSLGWRVPTTRPEINWSAEFVDQSDTYFIYGPQLDKVVQQYRQATGAPPMFGKWAYGMWQCKERYNSQQELLDVAHEFRARKIPIDNIVQDWFYWDPNPWGSHKFDPKRYPDMKSAMVQLHADNFHLMISVWGKFAQGSENYDELNAAGQLYPEMGDWGGAHIRYYDAFSPRGRAIYWRQMRDELLDKGIDGWWLDATEPEVSMNLYRQTQTALGPGARVLNAYSLIDTEGVYKGNRQARPDHRAFILTRSVFAGQQRNAAATWSGDIQGDWATFAKQIPCGLNFCMAGVPYWCTDIGGFFSHPPTDPAYKELFIRWFQYGTFCPIFRVHGTGAAKEPWRFGPDGQAILTKYDRLRYRLMPYIYSLAWQVSHDGGTMMRGLPMDFREDSRVLGIADQFMFGNALMIDPVIKPGVSSRSVYLPVASKWTDFWDGLAYTGGRSIAAEAPIERMPIFVRAGSIVPMGPELQYAMEKKPDPIEIRVYAGADGTFTLYEDGGEGYGYEHGQYATIPLGWNNGSRTLTIGARRGAFPGMLRSRRFRVVLVRPGHGVGLEQAAGTEVAYSGNALAVHLK